VRGILANEFSPYSGAMGPEGVRRTTMHYGPIVGGLPILAWHCEVCGLLKLDYPDGRKEDRRLFPGPQPGLLADPVAEVGAPEAHLGMQARVSGLSVSPEIATFIAVEVPQPRAPELPTLTLPAIPEVVDGLVVLGLVATVVGLISLGIGAVYDWTTAGWEGPAAAATGATFGGAILLKVVAAGFTHFFPFARLAPSPADTYRETPRLDATARAVVACLTLLAAGLLVAAVLAVYDWKPPDAEKPLAFGLIALFVLAVVVAVAGGAVRALRGETGESP
jgi:hypothetical protein